MKKTPLKRPNKKKFTPQEKLVNAFAALVFGVALIWIVMLAYQNFGSADRAKTSHSTLPEITDTLAHRKVCMVDDVYQGDYPTIATIIAGETYYGCDQKAIHDLIVKNDLRTAIDPVSKKRLNKASAVIAIHPDKDGKVLYFESKATYKDYINTLAADPKK